MYNMDSILITHAPIIIFIYSTYLLNNEIKIYV